MKQYETILRQDNPIILGHKINQIGVFPGVALLDFVYRTLRDLVPIEDTSLNDCLFHEAISFQHTSEKKLRLILDDTVIPYKIRVYSMDVNPSNQHDSKLVLNFESNFIPFKNQNVSKSIDIANLKQNSSHLSSFNEIYEGLKKVGIVHDDFMQVDGEIYQSKDFILLEIALSKRASFYLDKFSTHPAMLDAATIGSIIPIYQEIRASNHAFIPLTLADFSYVKKLPAQCYVLIHKKEVVFLDDIMKASVSIYAANGELVADLRGLVNKRIRSQINKASVKPDGGEPPTNLQKPIATMKQFSSAVELPNRSNVQERVQRSLVNLLNEYLIEPIEINEITNFYNLGLDSQSLISIVHKLEQMTGGQLYPTLLFEYNNLQKLSQYLSHQFPDFVNRPGTESPIEPKQTIDFLIPRWIELESIDMPSKPQMDRNNHDWNNARIKELIVISDSLYHVEQLRTNPDIIHDQIRVIQVIHGNEYCLLDENTYQVNLQNQHDLRRLLDTLWAQGIVPKNIIYCDLNSKYKPNEFAPIFQVALLLKNLQKLNVKSIRYLHCYVYDEYSINSSCTLLPYFKSLKLEEPCFSYQLIGLRDLISENYLVDLYCRFFSNSGTASYLLHGQKCYELNYCSLPNSISSTRNFFGKRNSTFIITGGAGKIGLSIAKHLVAQQNASVYLLGRSPIASSPCGANISQELRNNNPSSALRAPSPHAWSEGENEGSSLGEELSDIGNLPKNKIKYFSCDISNKEAVELFSREIQGQTIDALFHCAGVLKDALHENTDLEVFAKILQPKWNGTINLYELCTELKIPQMFLFSSLTSVLGNIGQTQYATANAFLDEFARVASIKHHNNPSLPNVVSVNWPLWQEGGMASEESEQILMRKWGLAPITTEMAFECLKVAIDSHHSQIVISNEVIKTYLMSNNKTQLLGKDEIVDIAIIGIAGRYPMAKDLDEFWVNLCSEKDCVTTNASERFPQSPYQFGGFLDDIDKFDPLFFGISPRDAKIMDPQERLFLQTAWNTFEDAGYGKLQRSRYDSIGVYVGAMFSLYQLNRSSTQNQQTSQLANSSFASIANRVSYCLDLNGPSLTLDTMCSSSLTALHYACESIKSGECQLALVGGVNLITHESKYDELLQRGFLSKEGRCQVFSANADGYVPGEGVGAVLLKRLDCAVKDNDHIYGIIKGSAINHSGRSDGYTVPSIEYQAKLICTVLDKTKIHPDSISYIEAHGTGTALGDPIELRAITNAYKNYHNKKHYCAIGSVKSNIGHLESAAGIAGLTKILLQFKHKKIVPSIHTKPINPNINLNELPCVIQDRLSDWDATEVPRRAAISGFGAGGANVHCILEEFRAEKEEFSKNINTHLFLFSAKSTDSLVRLMNNFHQWLGKVEENIDLHSLSLTLALGRDHFQHRTAIVANSVTLLRNQLCSQNAISYKRPGKNLEEITHTDEDSLLSLAYYYQLGEEINWERIYSKEEWHKISLPGYPFAEESYWVDTIRPLSKLAEESEVRGDAEWRTGVYTKSHEDSSANEQLALNFYAYKWLSSNQNVMLNEHFKLTESTKFFLIDLNRTRYELLKTKGFGDNLVLITPGNEMRQFSAEHYEFDFKNLEQCQFIIQQIVSSGLEQQVVFFYFLSDQSIIEDSIDSYDREFENAFLNFHIFCQILLRSSLSIPIGIKYFYRTSAQRPVCAAISAYLKTLMRENTKISGQVIKINDQNYSADYFTEIVKTELKIKNFNYIDIAYSAEERFYKSYEVINKIASLRSNTNFVEKNGIYLIIGGVGKLGLLIANYLASIEKVHLILVGRKQIDAQFLKHHLTLEKIGSEAIYYSCNVAQYDAVVELISKIKATHGKINGIINSSSSLKFSPVFNKSVNEILATLATKYAGTNNLDLATREEKLDWFVCFSSLAAVIGFPEGCDYAFGNAYLDEFVENRNRLVQEGKRYGRTIAFNWPVWQDGGMIKKNAETQQSWEDWMIKTQGVIPMSRERGLEAFERVMRSGFSQMIVAEGYDHLIQKTLNAGFIQRVKEVDHVKSSIPPKQGGASVFSSSDLENIIISTIAELLELPKNKIDLHKVFTDFGFDSVTLINFAERLSQRIKIEILPSIFFSENSIHKLTKHLTAYYSPNEVHVSEKKQIASGLEFAFTDKVKKPVHDDSSTVSTKQVASTVEFGKRSTELDDIAIVGMDGKFPNSDDLDTFWQNLVNGIDLISEIPDDRWDWQDYYHAQPGANQSHSKWGGFLTDIKSFDANFFKISDSEALMMDPQHRLFLEVAWRAIENAGQSPDALQGKSIGVFVGVQFNDYQSNLFANEQTNFYIATGNSHALIANRLSHLLDLNGPSEAIDTACSSALVALNRAVNAIKLGECESAIVGATTCILNPMSYVVTSQLGIISPEGRCKVFDAAANGYVKGEGAGVLWLMPLKMAKEQNYPIHGLIKGVGVNHGGKSTSLTAPNIKAQQQLLVNTYKKSNVGMDTISFIETHGTGTLLGDSVEIESIKAAFQELVPHASTTESMKCFLGSVKSNAGHLEPAAGIIGVIKILLMFKHATKVKNLNFDKLSPYIKLENSRLKIQEQSEAWVSHTHDNGEILPRRAGVNSFGFGGTNAHIILEEFIQSKGNEPTTKPYYLCVLSAKTESALFRHIRALQHHLINNPEESIESISYTLNAGRTHYKNRCALVVESVPALETALRLIGTNEEQKNVFFSSENNFASINQLHFEMHDYLQNKLIKSRLDPATYFNKLQSLAILYTQQFELNWALLHSNESMKRVSLPSYPFEKTNYWITPKRHPECSERSPNMWHSANSGRSLVAFGMTGEPLRQSVLGKNLSTPDSFYFELNLNRNSFYFRDHQVNHKNVLPGVIVLEILYEIVKFFFPNQPLWIIKEIYWFEPIDAQILENKLSIYLKPSANGFCFDLIQQQEMSKVFSKGEIQVTHDESEVETIDINTMRKRFVDEYTKEKIYKQFSNCGIDYGTSFQAIVKAHHGQNEVLSEIKLAKHVIETSEQWIVHPCLIDAALQSSALLFEQLNNIGYLYSLEEVMLFQELPLQARYFAHLQKRKDEVISLKLYDETGHLCLSIAKIIIKSQVKLSCLKAQWLESPLPRVEANKTDDEGSVLLIKTTGEQEKILSDSLIDQYSLNQILVLEWSQMKELFNPEQTFDYSQIYLLFNDHFELNNLAEGMTHCAHDLLFFLNTLAKKSNLSDLHLRFITINAFSETKRSSPLAAALTGLIHSFHQEKPEIKVSCIDVAVQQALNHPLSAMIKNEPGQSQSTIIAIDENSKRFVRQFCSHTFPKIDLKSYRTKGVYLIIGGANGVGYEFGQYLAKYYQARLVFVGRTPEVEQAHKIKRIQELGGSACYYQADVVQEQAIAAVFSNVQKKYGTINGVIHSALVLEDKTIDKIDLASIERVLNPKVLGTINLYTLLKESSLDFLLIFSSAQSYMNNSGQSTYAMASIFQDQFAKQFRSQVSFPIKVVNWGYWGTVGVVANEYYQQQMQRKGIFSINPREAFKLLEQFLMSSLDDCILLSASSSVIDNLTRGESSTFNEGFIALEQFTAQLLFSAFQKKGYFNETSVTYQISNLIESFSVQPTYQSLFLSLLNILHQQNLIHYDKNLELIKTVEVFANNSEQLQQKLIEQYPYLSSHIELVHQCMSSLFMVLKGQKRHTEVLFPDNQFQLVENVYNLHPISRTIIKQLVSYIIFTVKEFNRNNASVRFNLLEIGAGTGSATADILQSLQANNLKINYIFTDISEGFLQKARVNPRLHYEGIQLKCLDISIDPKEQGFETNNIDLVLANNVLHATGNIGTSLAHIELMLKDKGIVLINELTQTSNFLTTTFGLTPEWWKLDQNEETIAYSPLLSLENWKKVLTRYNFGSIQTPLLSETNPEALCEAQQIIIAKKLDSTKVSAELSTPNLSRLEDYLKTLFSEILRIPASEINNQVNLGDYGLDSLVTFEATARLKNVFHQFSNTVLFEYATIERLMKYLIDHYTDVLTNHFFAESNTSEHSELQGDAERRTGVYTPVHEDSSTASTKQFASSVEFGKRSHEHDIAVIGFKGRFPGAETAEKLWDLLANQKSALTKAPQERLFELSEYYAGFLEKVGEFDAFAFNISPREAEKMDPQERLFLECCWELFECSGYSKTHLATCDFNVGCFVGAMNTDYSLSTFTENNRTQHNYSALWSIANRVSYFFNLTGPSLVIDTACASSLTAIHMACQSIRQGECQLALAGGVNLILHPNHFAMLAETNMLSKKKNCQPFSEDADGMIIGEGVGAILLKPLSAAIKDKDIVHAVIKGSHMNSSGKTKGYMAPNPSVQATLMKTTLQRSGIDESTISYIETQGTGTKLGDEIEIEALQRVYGKGASIIGTLKSNMGHLESAAGVAGFIKILLQLRHKTILPAINGKQTNQFPLIKNSPFSLPEQLQEWPRVDGHPRRAAISAFGAGGSNAHLILEEFLQDLQENGIRKPYYLFLFSAKNDDSLTWGIRKLHDYLLSHTQMSLWDISYTLAVRKAHFKYRCALIVSSMGELLAGLKAVAEEKMVAKAWRSEGKVQINHALESAEIIEKLKQVDGASGESYCNHLAILGELYTQGAEVNWSELFLQHPCHIVELPTYSFMRQVYWSTQLKATTVHSAPLALPEKEPSLLVDDEVTIQDYLLTMISTLLKISKDILDPTENLLEYGFDSISLSYLLTTIESHYKLALTPIVVMEHSTVESLARYLQLQLQMHPAKSTSTGEYVKGVPCVE